MASRKADIVAIDIGGTKIEAILWRAGKILVTQKIPTPKNKHDFFKPVYSVAESLNAKGQARAIGISLAGAVDFRTGTVINSPNLRFLEGTNVQKTVEHKLKLQTLVENDTRCFLLGEVRFGSAKGKKNVIGMILGTGLGGAIYLNGQMVLGMHGFAGEQGRVQIAIDSHGYSIEELIASHGFARLGVTDPLDCQNKAFAGDRKSIAVYNKIGRLLGLHLANLTELFDPELIIIGGGISRAGNLLLDPAFSEMKKRVAVPKKYWPEIRVSKLKNAGLLGAIALVENS